MSDSMERAVGHVVGPQGPTIDELRIDFDLSLAAQNKSKQTRSTYGAAVRQLGEFLAERGMPTEVTSIAREHVEAFLADLLESGRSASTAKTRFGGLQVFFKWLLEEGAITGRPWSA